MPPMSWRSMRICRAISWLSPRCCTWSKPGVAERLRAFVENGGTLVVSYFSGIADETDLVFTEGYPGPLRDIVGVWVEEIDALPPTESNQIQFAGGIEAGLLAECRLFFERVHPEGQTQVVATYVHDFYAGEPAVTVNPLGAGRAYYVATVIEEDGLRKLLGAVAAEAGAALPLPELIPKNVEVTQRTSPDGHTLIYVLNHNKTAVTLPLGSRTYHDHLTDKSVASELTLDAYGVAILAESIHK